MGISESIIMKHSYPSTIASRQPQPHPQQAEAADAQQQSSSATATATTTTTAAELASVSQKLEEAEELNHRFSGLLGRFFAFEIQEGELRQAVVDLVPNVDAFLRKTPPLPSPRRREHPHHHQQQQHGSPHPYALVPASAAASSPAAPVMRPSPRQAGVWSSSSAFGRKTKTTTPPLPTPPPRQQTPPRRPPGQLSPISCSHRRCAGSLALPPPDEPDPRAHTPWVGHAPADPWGMQQHRERRIEASLEKEARDARQGGSSSSSSSRGGGAQLQQPQPRWRSPQAGGVAYAFEGHRQEGVVSVPGTPPTLAAYGREDAEQRLAEQLHRARQRMQRHIKLQEWLIRKEQLELEAMEREETERRLAEQARRDADLRFREHARRQKKKLEAYYSDLRRATSSDGGSDGGVGAGGLGPSPPPILDLRPLK
jgi:hypothetical protein